MGRVGTNLQGKPGPNPIEGTARLRSVRHMDDREEDIIMALNPRERALAMLAYANALTDSNITEIAEFALVGTTRDLVGFLDALAAPFQFQMSVDRFQFLLSENGIGRCQSCDKWMRVEASEFCDVCLKG